MPEYTPEQKYRQWLYAEACARLGNLTFGNPEDPDPDTQDYIDLLNADISRMENEYEEKYSTRPPPPPPPPPWFW